MFGIRSATGAVEESAKAVTELAESAREEILGLSAQVRTATEYMPFLVAGAVIALVGLLVIAIINADRA